MLRSETATNVDVTAALSSGRLREDLYYRISTTSVRVPPLRDRGDDITRLAEHFLEKYRRRHGRLVRGLSEPAYEMLLHYRWPGNVRELQNAIECGVLLARHAEVLTDDLPERVRAGAPAVSGRPRRRNSSWHLA